MENVLIYIIIIMKVAQLTNGVTICTLENNDYQILNIVPVTETNQTFLIFSVRSCHGIRIVFANNRSGVSIEDVTVFRPAYFVSIGNKRGISRIRTCLQNDFTNCFDTSVFVDAPDLLHCTKYRSFWISWKHNITLGKGNEVDEQALLTKALDEIISNNFIGLRTLSGNNDTWILQSGHEILGVNEKLLSQCSDRPSENSRQNNVISKHLTSYTTATNQHLSTNGVSVNEIPTTNSGLLTEKMKSPKMYSTTNTLTLTNNDVSKRFPATTEYTNSNLGIQFTTTHTINQNHDLYVSKPFTSTDIEQSGHLITTDIITFTRIAQQSTVSSTKNSRRKKDYRNFKCNCRCPTLSSRWNFFLDLNLTRKQLSEIMTPYLIKLKKSIEVNKKETNTYKLKLVCANDDRLSSEWIGLIGIIIICSVLIFFVTLDVIGCFINRTDKKKQSNRK